MRITGNQSLKTRDQRRHLSSSTASNSSHRWKTRQEEVDVDVDDDGDGRLRGIWGARNG